VVADRLREDVLVRHDPREVGREPAGVDFLLHDGVIARQALELAAPVEVDATVADVPEVRLSRPR
jgi:hypothetical protein